MEMDSNKSRRGVVICGAYGMQNAGDDAVLAAVCRDLRRLERDIPITVLARNPKSTARRFGVTAIHPLNIPRWLMAMKRAKLFISGGGSLLQDVTSRRSLWYYLATIALAKKMGCAVQLYGCGIGPITGAKNREQTAKVLNACADVITLRDKESMETLQTLGVTEPRTLLAADPALRLDAVPGDRERKIGIVVRPWPEFWAHIPDFAAAARHAYETYRLTPMLICMAPTDHAAASSLCTLLERQHIPCSISQHPRRIGQMSLVLSMRLHGLIFALRDGALAAGVSYDPKVSSFCREAGLPCTELAEATSALLCGLVDQAIHLDAETLAAARDTLRQRERVNARAAAELL